jgi:RNA polymerase sigma-70 factor (ECF subfamily)
METSDADLMARVRGGDREAFGCLVDRHKDRMVNYLTRLTGCRDRAEETAQEAFLRLYRSAPRYHEQGRLAAYLYRIATNLVRQEDRRARRRRVLTGMFLSPANGHRPNGHQPAHAPQSSLLRDELQGQLVAALGRLPLRYRVAVVLRDVQGWPYEEIARMTGCRQGTVKSRISRGRSMLRQWLEPYMQRGEDHAG